MRSVADRVREYCYKKLQQDTGGDPGDGYKLLGDGPYGG